MIVLSKTFTGVSFARTVDIDKMTAKIDQEIKDFLTDGKKFVSASSAMTVVVDHVVYAVTVFYTYPEPGSVTLDNNPLNNEKASNSIRKIIEELFNDSNPDLANRRLHRFTKPIPVASTSSGKTPAEIAASN